MRRLQTSNDAPRGTSVVVGGRAVERELFYDTVARRIAATDPDTDNRGEADPDQRTWRYVFNRVGDLAGVRDPRGCGQNFRCSWQSFARLFLAELRSTVPGRASLDCSWQSFARPTTPAD